ncbi:hypothetical protein [Streptomyces sp. NPDC094049]|uniref:hypothetical protein n=1 Tax=Streptomyces sp. NPDC094049 TaxID=3154987 RepID=UPI00332AB861
MSGPVLSHFLLRPATTRLPGVQLPTTDETLEIFTQNFLGADARPEPLDGIWHCRGSVRP